ncbi:hypothetical protein [Alkalicoccobacillus porphyridii]|uniref:Uncharacterized protein n=1 Tax=Alkalicoccobacillus porphyridii TaxID=2597270 RepID=A0A553ZT72_9BACI|nr:hypothetical protein [Alkalicoccobacillus porphyridii]TSB44668.1 hypothetical protein FN960_20130 [Alkalicoccobacillus porphyridii]
MQLDHFNKDPLYSKALEYWCEAWKIFSKKVENGTLGIDIVNIRTILLDIINEYELNKFESDNNRKVYLNLIDNLISKKHMKLYRDELLILKNRLEKKDSQSVYVIAKELTRKIAEENFAQMIFDDLLVIFKKKLFSKKDRIKIKNLTKDIIVDLVTSGRNVEDIKDLLTDIFQTYGVFEKKIVIFFKFTPSDLSPEQAKEYNDNLTLKDRLELLRENLLVEKSAYLFIFPVWGMIASHLKDENYTLFGFDVYDPLRENKLPINDFADETFNTEKEMDDVDKFKNDSRCNVIIQVDAISINVAYEKAEEKYSILLSLLNLKFANKRKEFFWNGEYIGRKKVDTESGGLRMPFNLHRDEKVFRRKLSKGNPIHFSADKFREMKNYSDVIDTLEKRNMFIESNTIINVIQLMSKSTWETEENKLLNYWICIESLANISKKNNESKFTFIKETISNMYFLWEKFGPIHDLFLLTEHYARSSYNNDESINIPDEFLENVYIFKARSEDSTVSLVKFYKRMKELSSYTTKESFLDSIEDTLNFYQDNKKALQILLSKKDEVKLTIDYIYKSRNQIVHNGYVAKNLIPYLVHSAEGYARSLFQRIIDVYLEDEFDLQNYFVKEKYEGDLLEKKLTNKDYYEIGLEE